VSFNRPTDYDFNTGIMNTNSGTGAPQETFRFQAKSCKNIFSKGRFEQELVGSLIPPTTNAPPATNSRSTQVTSATNSRESSRVNDGSLGYEVRDETGAVSNLRKNEFGELYDPAGVVLQSPRPAPPPQPATSTGEIQNIPRQNIPSTEFAAFEDALNPASPTPRRNFGETDIDFATQSALVPTAPTPTARRNFGQTDIDFSTQSAVVPTPPQPMNRET
jgi:hypothetical protein